MRPVEGSSLEMGRRPLYHDVRVKRSETLFGIVAVCWSGPTRHLLTGEDHIQNNVVCTIRENSLEDNVDLDTFLRLLLK